MKFYRDMEIEYHFDIQISPDKLIQRLSNYTIAAPKWYAFESPVKEDDKPYVGIFTNNLFDITKKGAFRIRGQIERRYSGSRLSLIIKDSSRPSRSPGYWAGSKDSALIGFLAAALIAPALMISSGITSLTLIVFADVLLLTLTCYVIVKTNKICEKILKDKVANEVDFIMDILEATNRKIREVNQ